MTHHLTYISSTEITTTNLVSIEGYDVIDYTALISKDSTLIVAATCGKDIYHIPNLVKRIGTSALRGSKLKSLVIPASVTDIGDLAFDHTEITSYYFLSTDIPNLSLHAFGNHMDEKVTIYVPRKSLKAYRRCWKPLKKHIKALPRSIDIIATEQFDMTYDYKLKYGLQITENGQIVNKNNKFLPDDFTVALDTTEAYLWREISKDDSDCTLMKIIVYFEFGDIENDEIDSYCLKILQKWFDKGLICKSIKPDGF